MRKRKIEECIHLTSEMLSEYYEGKLDLLRKYLHKDCLWIGEIDTEYHVGKSEILNVIVRKKDELPKISLMSKEFQCACQDRNSCIITGRYIGKTEENSDIIIRDMQRVTFAWKEDKTGLYLIHMHVSNPVTYVKHEESFPNSLGKFTKDYLDMLIHKEVEKDGFINVKDKENRYHNLNIRNIVYIEAFNVNSLIHTVDDDIYAKTTILNLEETLKSKHANMFIRVHKSFLVNKYYVTNIRRYDVTLVNEYVVPIPKEKYKRVREQLQF